MNKLIPYLLAIATLLGLAGAYYAGIMDERARIASAISVACTIGDVYLDTSNGVFYKCNHTNQWDKVE